MRAFVGDTRSRKLIARLEAAGIGECIIRGRLRRPRRLWFYDNGAWADFVAGLAFDGVRYTRDLWRIAYWKGITKPAFIVLPDTVAGGLASLDTSLEWVQESTGAGAPLYLAVQDGMSSGDVVGAVLEARGTISGLFVGGSLAWKLETGAAWVQVAHAHGWQAHIGRVGQPERVQWARAIGADSIDSCGPLWSDDKLTEFLAALGAPEQTALFD